MTLPTLDLSGVSYGLRLIEAGEPAALVVEKPDDYAGKEFRFAEGDGFRSITLGKAMGPYRNLMSLPPHAIRGLDATRLRELGESRDLYLVSMTESTRLQEEGESETEGGMHWHPLFEDRSRAEMDDAADHRHVYLIEEELELEGGATLPANSLVFTDLDGAHAHEIAEDGNHTEEDGAHGHTVKINMPDGTVFELMTGEAGEHVHQLMVLRTGLDGLHQHELTISGRTLTSLSPAEFAGLAQAEGETGEAPPPTE